MKKKYYALLNTNQFYYLGEFPNYSEAHDYAEYEININYVWIYKLENLKKLSGMITDIIDSQNL
jgi:hypothetical protein